MSTETPARRAPTADLPPLSPPSSPLPPSISLNQFFVGAAGLTPRLLAVYQVRTWYAGSSEAVVGPLTGVLLAAFSAARVAVPSLWARGCDATRSPKALIVLTSLLGGASSAWFCMSASFWPALAARLLAGALTTPCSLVRAVIRAASPPGPRGARAEALGMAARTVGLGAAVIVAPPILGILATPCAHAWHVASRSPACAPGAWLATHPFALPGVFVLALAAASTAITLRDFPNPRVDSACGEGPRPDPPVDLLFVPALRLAGGPGKLGAAAAAAVADADARERGEAAAAAAGAAGHAGGGAAAVRRAMTMTRRAALVVGARGFAAADGAVANLDAAAGAAVSQRRRDGGGDAGGGDGDGDATPWFRCRAAVAAVVTYAIVTGLFDGFFDMIALTATAPSKAEVPGIRFFVLAWIVTLGGAANLAMALTGYGAIARAAGPVRAVQVGLAVGAAGGALVAVAAGAGAPLVGTRLLQAAAQALYGAAAGLTSSGAQVMVNLAAPSGRVGAINRVGNRASAVARVVTPLAAGGLWAVVAAPTWFAGWVPAAVLAGLFAAGGVGSVLSESERRR